MPTILVVMARPKVNIDWVMVDRFARAQCKPEEIAAWFECSVDTIDNAVKQKHGITFTSYVKKGNEQGRAKLREELFDRAYDRKDSASATIALHLDKKYIPGGIGPEYTLPALQGPTQTIQVIDSSRSTVDLLREVLGKPKLVTSGETDE